MSGSNRARVLVVVVLWLFTRALATIALAPSNDVMIYRAAAYGWLDNDKSEAHAWRSWEYPPLALVLVSAARALAPLVLVLPDNDDDASSAPTTEWDPSFASCFALLILAFDALNVWLTSRLSRNRVLGALLYVAAGALLGELLVQRLDVPVATSIALALVLALRSKRVGPAEIVVAAGALVKLVPILALPALWVARSRATPRMILASSAVALLAIALGLAPFLALMGGDALAFIGFHADRGVQIESVPASLLLLARTLGLIDVRCVFEHGAMHLAPAHADASASASASASAIAAAKVVTSYAPPIALLVVAALLLRRARDARQLTIAPATLCRIVAALLLTLLLTSRVLSPQFLIWLLPLLCAIAAHDDDAATERPRGFITALLLSALLTGFIAKFAYRALIDMSVIAVLLLVVRNAILGWMLVALVRAPRAQERAQRSRPLLSPEMARIVLFAALVVLVVLANARDVSSTDFWLHRRIGEDILASGAIPRVDAYAATTLGAPFVAHEWLAGVLLYLVDVLGGSVALVLLRIALVLVVVIAAIRATPRMLRRHVAAIPVALAALSVIEGRTEVRPHLFALACLAVLVALARRGRYPSTSPPWFVAVAALHVLWANLHASVFLGPALLALVAAADAAWPPFRVRASLARGISGMLAHNARVRAFGLAALVALLASFVNPRGPGLLWFALTTSSSAPLREYIHEWRPLFAVWSPGISNLCFAVLCCLLVVVTPFLWHARRERAWIVVSFVLSLAAISANRFQAEAALVAAPVVLAGLARALRVLRIAVAHEAVWAPLACIVVVLLFVGGSPLGTGYGVVPADATAALARYAAQHPPSAMGGAILNEYNDGGYLISEIPAQLDLRPVMDGRLDVHGAARFEEWRNAWTSADAVWRYSIEHGVVAVVIDANDRTLLPALRHDARWRMLHEDGLRVVFVRAPRNETGAQR